jgi:hypothetical protein
MVLKETGCEAVEWVNATQIGTRVQGWTLLTTVINIFCP